MKNCASIIIGLLCTHVCMAFEAQSLKQYLEQLPRTIHASIVSKLTPCTAHLEMIPSLDSETRATLDLNYLIECQSALMPDDPRTQVFSKKITFKVKDKNTADEPYAAKHIHFYAPNFEPTDLIPEDNYAGDASPDGGFALSNQESYLDNTSWTDIILELPKDGSTPKFKIIQQMNVFTPDKMEMRVFEFNNS